MKTSIRTILLVDDDLDDQEFFNEALKIVDPSVKLNTAKNGIEAIERLRFAVPDLILLDLNMPQMNGVDCLKELKSSSDTMQIPVAIYSSFVSSVDMKEVTALGVGHFIRKPISFIETVETIRQALLHTNWTSTSTSQEELKRKLA